MPFKVISPVPFKVILYSVHPGIMVYMGRLIRDGIKSINDTCGHAGTLVASFI